MSSLSSMSIDELAACAEEARAEVNWVRCEPKSPAQRAHLLDLMAYERDVRCHLARRLHHSGIVNGRQPSAS